MTGDTAATDTVAEGPSRPRTAPLVREYLNAIRAGQAAPPPAARLLGVHIVDVTDGRAVFGLRLRPHHDNGDGRVHGGFIATLVDFAVAAAVNDVQAGAAVATATLNLTYTQPVIAATGEIRATAQVVHRTGRTAIVEAKVTSADETLHALATATCIVNAPVGAR
jgi:uncharacterized protein (TIGR00369 family)